MKRVRCCLFPRAIDVERHNVGPGDVEVEATLCRERGESACEAARPACEFEDARSTTRSCGDGVKHGLKQREEPPVGTGDRVEEIETVRDRQLSRFGKVRIVHVLHGVRPQGRIEAVREACERAAFLRDSCPLVAHEGEGRVRLRLEGFSSQPRRRRGFPKRVAGEDGLIERVKLQHRRGRLEAEWSRRLCSTPRGEGTVFVAARTFNGRRVAASCVRDFAQRDATTARTFRLNIGAQGRGKW